MPKEINCLLIDSDGIQEETTILQVLFMILRESTERSVTITEDINRLIHIDTNDILNNYNEIKAANFAVEEICENSG